MERDSGCAGKIIGLLKADEEVEEGHKLNNFQLTKDEADLVEALSKRVTANVDQKTSVVTIDVKMQDPLVSAMLADTVVTRLQEYVTSYRTNKARRTLNTRRNLTRKRKAGIL